MLVVRFIEKAFISSKPGFPIAFVLVHWLLNLERVLPPVDRRLKGRRLPDPSREQPGQDEAEERVRS
jgi:hypothetical protein